MPSVQRGSVVKKNGGWQARWYDETDTRQSKAGFATKTAGREWLDDKVKEVAALRRGDPTIVRRQTIPTYNELCDEYLAQHHGQANTLRGLKLWLASSRRKWGTMRIDRITADVALWRRTQPERSAWHYHRGLKQVLGYAVRTKLLDENVAEHVPNPQPRVREVQVFDLAEIEAIAAELAPMFRAIPMFAAFTGLRPEEWIPLERNDVDRRAMTVRVRRVYTDGVLKDTGKTAGSLRYHVPP